MSWLAGCVLALAAQGPDVFTAHDADGRLVVTGERTAIDAARALRELGNTMGWRVDFATTRLETDLSTVSIDISFDELNPRTIAHLLAATGDADVVFDDQPQHLGATTVVHVVPAASAELESGRQRLRARAMEWYQMFLSDDLRLDPLVATKAPEVRMHLGHMLLEQGNLAQAIEVFQKLQESEGGHPYVPLALLRIAECHHDLGEYDKAEKWAREVSRMHPSRPETAAATVLLGRNLIAQQRYDECIVTMRASMLALANTPEIVDILLITAAAHRHRQRPDYVLDQMELLAESHSFRDLTETQWLDYHFLRGLGAEGVGRYSDAIEALEIFLATGLADPRRGQALVLLGQSYLANNQFVEARAAALQAVAQQSEMEDAWRKRARILQARTGLALGQRDRAFEQLEREVRSDPTQGPELVVFLVESFLDARRFQKAIDAADLLRTTKGELGDRARYLKILAMWRQNPQAEMLDSFLIRALQIAPAIEDEDLQRRAAEVIGKAYGVKGEWEKAINAYRGILQ